MRMASTFSLCLMCAAAPLLTGCALTSADAPAAPVAETGAALHGVVHGGQQPVAGAHVYLFGAQNLYLNGGPGIAASNFNASVSLLKASSTGYSDSIGAYVLTGADGSFSISGDYTCAYSGFSYVNQQVYLYAVGGNPGYGGTNSAAGFLAVLGPCPSAGNLAATTPDIFMNEVSTVAAAYAIAGYASNATHVASGDSALSGIGMANAFANAANLANLSTGVALTATSAGNGTVPQTMINTIANILAACVNSSGPSSIGCTKLFGNILSAGATGTAATDTATAAIYLAQHPFPGSSQVTALYANAVASPPFAPALTNQPTDFAVALSFTGGGLNFPEGIAIDASGDVWVANGGSDPSINGGNGSITELSSQGAILSGTNGFTGGGIYYPEPMAIDASGNVWIANEGSDPSVNGGNGSITELSSSGVALTGSNGFVGDGINYPDGIAVGASSSPADIWVANANGASISKLSGSGSSLAAAGYYTGGGLSLPYGIAVDGAANAWIANLGNSDVIEILASNYTSAKTFTGEKLDYPYGIALDSSGNAWVADDGSNAVIKVVPSNAAQSTSYTATGLNYPGALALDGSGNVWVANGNAYDVIEISSAGTFLSGTGGYKGGGKVSASNAIAVDGSGNVWMTSGYSNVIEIVGSATPVITPICVGLPPTPGSNGSSLLGTRP
jgi:streptogramin lyase